ncbi:MAG: 30S ribosomal protein S18 [Acetobacter sp.]|nr:30S ribosomal protein S18 [Bacteroides sp.]MCM1340452.1 30S ribosomal protein S18 [Acetobacter sp.]MCM1432901.1 30S ribosomal protein S18 [Clostridiales bacterium]
MAYNKQNGPRKSRKKVCVFCVEKVEEIDYKDVTRLKRFVSERAKILPRRVTGTCAKHQRELTTAIKRARHIAILPYSAD